MEGPAGPIHGEFITIMRGKSDDGVALEIRSILTVAGEPHPVPDRQIMYEHWMERSNLKQLPDRAVEAQGMTYHCKVYQVSSGIVVGDNRTGGKSTICLNDAIPGGVV